MGIRKITDLGCVRAGPTPTDRAPRTATWRQAAEVVEAATSNAAGVPFESTIQCRRRPGRQPCEGHLEVRRQDLPPEIHWICTACRDEGLVRNWKGTPWDFAGVPHRAAVVAVYLAQTDFDIVAARAGSDAGSRSILRGARRQNELLVVEGAPERLSGLRDALFRGLPGSRPSERPALQRVIDRIELRLRHHTTSGR